MKIVFLSLLFIHALIHLPGFLKGFRIAGLPQLNRQVSKPEGIAWLGATLLFLVTLCALTAGLRSWWIAGAAAVIVSEILVIIAWSDARYATILNVIILIPVIVALSASLPSSYENRYETEVRKRLARMEPGLLTPDDVRNLPAPVQKYLAFTGAIGKPKVWNFRAMFHGTMKRTLESGWTDVDVRQYDFFDEPARLFYITSSVYGVPFDGLHAYVGDSATMQIKIASLVQVVDARGVKMTRGETVTLFNDMCVLAPATLISPAISWVSVDSLHVRATFTNHGSAISALLTFSSDGGLVDFLSNDRFLSEDGTTYLNYTWSTPVTRYADFGGRVVSSFGEDIWHMPGGNFPYARYDLTSIEYNCTVFQ